MHLRIADFRSHAVLPPHNAERSSRLHTGQTHQVEERDGFPLASRQGRHHPPDACSQLVLFGQPRWVWRAPDDCLGHALSTEQAVERQACGWSSSQPAAADVQTDAGRPGSEARRLLEPVEPEQRLQDGLLRGIIGQGRVTEAPLAQDQQHPLVAHDQFGKSLRVS